MNQSEISLFTLITTDQAITINFLSFFQVRLEKFQKTPRNMSL